jgi:adenylyltransferase/sulfurtransferase
MEEANSDANSDAETLRDLILQTEQRLDDLKNKLAEVERRGYSNGVSGEEPNELEGLKDSKWPLTPEEYLRYGRQMIVPSIGIQGQHFIIPGEYHETY